MVNLLEFIEGSQAKKSTNKDFFVSTWHNLMKAYESWIPFEEYKKLSPELISELAKLCAEDAKEIKRRSKLRK